LIKNDSSTAAQKAQEEAQQAEWEENIKQQEDLRYLGNCRM
jgi:proteasome assembly chaperone (PAC2) family protein